MAPVPAPAEHDVGGLRAPLVGREDELRALDQALARLQAGIGGIVTVVGEAGIGKSRLVAEARIKRQDVSSREADAATDAASLRWVEGRWLSYTEGMAYYGWQELLRHLLALPETCTPSTCGALEDRIAGLCPGQVDALYPYLARLLALPVADTTAAQLDGLVSAGLLQNAIFRAVADLVTCVTMQEPLVLVLEDTHWADEASLALLEDLMTLTDRLPLLLLVVMRPVRTHRSWRIHETAVREYRHRHIDIELRPLSADENELLVRRLLASSDGDGDADPALITRVQERAEGNPFFTAELIRSLLDQGATAEELPPTIQDLLIARIDRLPVGDRRILQLAAVVGRIFDYGVVADILAAPDQALLDASLLRLVRAQMIRQHVEAPTEDRERHRGRVFVFEHQLTLEATYAGLLHSKRRVLHRRVAEALERLYPERIQVQLAQLAHHWEEAGETDRAIDYLQRAGEQATAQYANAEASALYTRALALVPDGDDETRYSLLMARERIHHHRGDRDAQNQDLERLETLVSCLEEPRKQAEVAIRRADHDRQTYRLERARREAERAVQLARDVGDTRLSALAHLRLAQAWSQPGASSDRAFDYLQQALNLAESAESKQTRAEILDGLGRILSREQQPAARQLLRQALKLYREIDDLAGEAGVLDALTSWHQAAGEYQEARELGLQTLEVAQQVGGRYLEGGLRITLGYVATCLGLYSEALGHLSLARVLLHEVGDYAYESNAVTWEGIVMRFLGQYTRAQAKFEQARAYPLEQTGLFLRLVRLGQTALLLLHQGDAEGALSLVRHELDLLNDAGDLVTHGWFPYVVMRAHLVMGHTLARLGDAEGAVAAYQTALDLEQKAGPPSGPYEVRAGLARVDLNGGEVRRALDQVEQILSYLETGHVYGAMEPLRIYLTCYHVLNVAGDPRARRILREAHDLLQHRATMIEDESLRRSYLENVATNREIIAAWHRS